ncbi:hypothetical protein T4D_3063 [Trichinella pseudospiralis]|uniref:Uncharacterized protein n=1 Tax=Trichinella pseudospiralis TaxID=6337 RepID=A0A0V1FPC5_TRIPS|nr:hypothetical protein T4D_3063 [Trichinella pseudospiralis]
MCYLSHVVLFLVSLCFFSTHDLCKRLFCSPYISTLRCILRDRFVYGIFGEYLLSILYLHLLHSQLYMRKEQ